MNLNAVFQRCIDNPDFLQQLRETVTTCKAEGPGSSAMSDLHGLFHTNPADLVQLRSAPNCGSGGSALVPLIEALRLAPPELPEHEGVFATFGINASTVEQLKSVGCGSGGTAVAPVIEALQVMHSEQT